MIEKLQKEFNQRYEMDTTRVFFCPGRINLIGEHIDYNGGKVLPAAISLGTWCACSFNETNNIQLQALNFDTIYNGPIVEKNTTDHWYNYAMGVFYLLQNEYKINKGVNLLFSGNLPIGAGLSSSASIEVLTTYALCQLFQIDMDRKTMAIFSKKVENEYIGVNCGIMDQYAVANGKVQYALLLDCNTITHEYVPANFDNHIVVIINTNKPRNLISSKYNERYQECQEALMMMQQYYPIQNLCELKEEEYIRWQNNYEEANFWKRGLHAVQENSRVQNAVQFLKEYNTTAFGELLFQSHDSLKNLYEVSGIELDTIVDFCKTYKHCIGARMTGAGFGGCAIALVHEKHFEDFAVELMMYYKKNIGYSCGVYKAIISDGVHEIL